MAETNMYGSTDGNKQGQYSFDDKATTLGTPFASRGKQSAILTLYFQTLLPQIDHEFKNKQIPFWVIKGPAMANRYYPKPSQRTYTDIDLFVENHQWEKSLQILRELGGQCLEPKKWMGNLFRSTFLFDGFPVEIHRSLLVDRPIDSQLIKNSRSTKIPGVSWAKEPSAEDLFVYLCGHGAFQHLFDEIHWLYDLNCLLLTEANKIDWNYLLMRGQDMGLSRAIGVSLILLETHYGHCFPQVVNKAPWYLRMTCRRFLSPERIRKQAHLRPRFLYLLYKALLRDSFREVVRYSWSRLKK